MRTRSARLTLAAAALAAVVVVSCETTVVEVVPVSTVSIQPISATEILPGDNVTLSARVSSSEGESLQRTISWSSSNTAVATVDQSGRVTAVAPGTTQITATADGIGGQVSLTVTDPCRLRPVTGASTFNGTLRTQSCQVNSRPADRYGLSSSGQFGARVILNSTAFDLSLHYAAGTAQNNRGLAFFNGSSSTQTTLSSLVIFGPGNYIVSARTEDTRTGAYSIQFQFPGSNPTVTGCETALVFPPIVYQGVVSSSDCAPRTGESDGFFDRFAIALRTGETISLRVSSNFDVMIDVRDGAGNLLLRRDDFFILDETAQFTAPATGLFFIEIRGFDTTELGNYTLTLSSNLAGINADAGSALQLVPSVITR